MRVWLIICSFLFASTALAPVSAEQQESSDGIIPLNHLSALTGDYFKIESKVVQRPFHIYVRLPLDYAEHPEKNYPIVYLLDGDSTFPMLAANHIFLHYDDKLPEAILVGIAYGGFDPEINKRGYDFSSPANDALKGQGGAPKFQAFLKNELLPTVESRFRVERDRRVLVGQSRGGHFVLYSAFTDPDLFWGRIASNPSLKPGAERFFQTPSMGERTDLGLVYASGSKDRDYLREDALKWFAHWKDRTDAPWAIHAVTIEDGTHAADLARVYRIGMNWFFRNKD